MIYLKQLIIEQALLFFAIIVGDINHRKDLLDLVVLSETMLLVLDALLFLVL